MGGDDSQKLLPWRGIYSSPGRKPPAHYEINTVTEMALRFARLSAGVWLSYRLPGSFLASTGGSVLARAEALYVPLPVYAALLTRIGLVVLPQNVARSRESSCRRKPPQAVVIRRNLPQTHLGQAGAQKIVVSGVPIPLSEFP